MKNLYYKDFTRKSIPVKGMNLKTLKEMVSTLKYNEHNHYLQDEQSTGNYFDPNEIIHLVSLPNGVYFTITRGQYTEKISDFVTWSEKLQMYTYRDKDYIKLMNLLDQKIEPFTFQNNSMNSMEANNKSSIIKLLEHWNITNYTISHNKVNVDGNVLIKFDSFSYLPVQFEQVTGDFILMYNAFETLENCPEWVGGNFIVKQNRLTTLRGGPSRVLGSYDCSNNYLTSLKGSPEIIKNFDCSNNNLRSLEGCPLYVNGDFNCSHNYISNLLRSPLQCKGTFNCQDNVINNLEGIPFLVKKVLSKNNPINDVY